jgi:hypothetical protein
MTDQHEPVPVLRVDVTPPPADGENLNSTMTDVLPPDVQQAIVSAAVSGEHDSGPRGRDSAGSDEFKGTEPDPILGAMRRTPDPETVAQLVANPEIINREAGKPILGGYTEELTREALRLHERGSDYDEEPKRFSLGMVLLASYASAITIALIWLVASGRVRLTHAMPPTIAADSRPDLGADGARALPSAERIPDDHLAALGQTLRLGSIEITPKGISAGPVALENLAQKGAQLLPKGKNALSLHLLVKNVSSSLEITPFDRAFVRRPDRGLPESFIENGKGERIDPYAVAVESEITITGQSFQSLKPGESMETVVVSDDEARKRVADPMTWRFRIRTGADETQLVGVRFRADEIQ